MQMMYANLKFQDLKKRFRQREKSEFDFCQNSELSTFRAVGKKNLQTNTSKRKSEACCRVLLVERRLIDGKLSVALTLDTSPASLPVTATSIPSGEH